jgi:hypothetical protein
VAALAKKAARVAAFCAGDEAKSSSLGTFRDNGGEKSLNVDTSWGGEGAESVGASTLCGNVGLCG